MTKVKKAKPEALKFDSEKPRMELLSRVALEGCARVLTFGAQKYTKHGDCTCGYDVTAEKKSTQEKCVADATINGSSRKIQNSQNPNKNHKLGGKPLTPSAGRKFSETLGVETPNENETPRGTNTTELPQSSMPNSVPKGAKYAGPTSGPTSTTTTSRGSLGVSYATHATSGSGSSNGQTIGLEKHSSTCASLKTTEGAHNWRKGFEWSRLIGAAMRHLTAILDGEDTDPESGLPHVDHLACCVMFLSEHQKKNLGIDDRYKGNNP